MASPSLTQSGCRPVCQRLEVFSYFLSYGFVLIFLFLYIIFLSRSLGTNGAPDCSWIGGATKQHSHSHTIPPSEVVRPRVNTQWFLFVFCLMALYSYFCFLCIIFLSRSLGLQGGTGPLSKGGVSTTTPLPTVDTAMGPTGVGMAFR